MMRLLKFLAAAAVCAALAACSDDMNSGSIARTEVSVSVEIPELPEGAELVDRVYTFRNVSTDKTTRYAVDSDIELLPGLYDAAFSARVLVPGAAETALRANVASVNISGASTQIYMKAYNNRETDDLIIAEVFFTGTLQSSGNQYNGDDYVKLYNNTDHVIYADGITLF